MDFANEERRIPVSMVSGAVYASIQLDPDTILLQWLREDLLNLTIKHSAKGVLLDVSGITILDGESFIQIVNTTHMLKLIGAKTVVVGLRPGIIAGLCALNVALNAIDGANSVAQALELLDGR
ncbi:hypothetical protein [Deefgea piscis]|uniref:hypothetical protein n=1 Tax=Deefgea piscis TaxID=2739061 RepID=UPI001C7FF043|nr:hypothetical protein [Deefgea piscis]QZA82409.1 hypothetical protein K4H25_07180 [Deefgea piscis]